jgi:hypothetical protein
LLPGIFRPTIISNGHNLGPLLDNNSEAERAIIKTLLDDILGMRNFDTQKRHTLEEVDISISTWNGLAGRSTTKTEGIYVELASCLDFKLRQFRAFKTLEEKVQRMMFSIEEQPFSLFFNPGPRLDAGGHQRNRWVPTQVSPNLLLSGSTFVLPSPDISKYSDQGAEPGPEFSIFLLDEATAQLSDYIIWKNGDLYQIHPALAPADRF